MVAAKKKREAEAEAGSVDAAGAADAPRVAEYMSTPLVAPPPVAPPGATEASIAAELQRWPAPPGEASREVVVQVPGPTLHALTNQLTDPPTNQLTTGRIH